MTLTLRLKSCNAYSKRILGLDRPYLDSSEFVWCEGYLYGSQIQGWMDERKDIGAGTPLANFMVMNCAWIPQPNPSRQSPGKSEDNEKQGSGSLK